MYDVVTGPIRAIKSFTMERRNGGSKKRGVKKEKGSENCN